PLYHSAVGRDQRAQLLIEDQRKRLLLVREFLHPLATCSKPRNPKAAESAIVVPSGPAAVWGRACQFMNYPRRIEPCWLEASGTRPRSAAGRRYIPAC